MSLTTRAERALILRESSNTATEPTTVQQGTQAELTDTCPDLRCQHVSHLFICPCHFIEVTREVLTYNKSAADTNAIANTNPQANVIHPRSSPSTLLSLSLSIKANVILLVVLALYATATIYNAVHQSRAWWCENSFWRNFILGPAPGLVVSTPLAFYAMRQQARRASAVDIGLLVIVVTAAIAIGTAFIKLVSGRLCT